MKPTVLSITCLSFLSFFWYAVAADSPTADALPGGIILVKAAGAKADGVTDDTAAIQNALDETAKTGGRVYLPPARYLVKGSLRIPPAVMLQDALDAPVWSQPLKGSVILATGGRDKEDAPPRFDLGDQAILANNEPASSATNRPARK